MADSKVHVCGKSTGLYTVENRGDGWYLYSGDERGLNPINFCPQCGKSTEALDKESNAVPA